MTSFRLFFLLFVSTSSFAIQLSGTVVNSSSRVPIPYVNIGVPEKGVGTISDDNGRFKISIDNGLVGDSIRFSCIGYKPTFFTVKKLLTLNAPIVIELMANNTLLREVVINAKKLKHGKVGSNTTAKFLISGLGIGDLGGEVGTRLRLKSRTIFIDSLHFFIAANSFDTVVFRLNIYPLKGAFPKSNVLKRNIIIPIIGKKKGWIHVDLDEDGLCLRDDFIATLELVAYSQQKKGGVYFSQSPPYLAPMYYRNKSQDVVKRFKGGPMGIYFDYYYDSR